MRAAAAAVSAARFLPRRPLSAYLQRLRRDFAELLRHVNAIPIH